MHPGALPSVHPRDTAYELLLDVREDDEWAVGHAPQAVHVPLHELPSRLDDVRAQAGGTPVSVICRVGSRSAQATAYLRQAGIDARNVEGGMFAWQAAGLPVVAGDGPGSVL